MGKTNLNLIRKLVKAGLGRRRIAEELDITEWHARSLIAQLDELRSNEDKTKQKDIPIKRTGTPTPIRTSRKTSGKPTISVREASFDKSGATALDADKPVTIQCRQPSFKVAMISDFHYPYQDENAIRLTQEVLKDEGPDIIVFGGDVADCYQASKYLKDPHRKMTLQEELDYTAEKLEEWVNMFPDTEFIFLEGNHEERLMKLAQRASTALASLRSSSIKQLLCLPELDIQFIPASKDLEIGRLTIMHGYKARKHAGTTARAHFEDYGCSVIVGHIHRLSTAWKRNKYGSHALIENGCLCDLDVEYLKYPDWQQGFSIINFDGDDFSVVQYPIVNHKIITPGKVYTT